MLCVHMYSVNKRYFESMEHIGNVWTYHGLCYLQACDAHTNITWIWNIEKYLTEHASIGR